MLRWWIIVHIVIFGFIPEVFDEESEENLCDLTYRGDCKV